jgi:hypothetical protein
LRLRGDYVVVLAAVYFGYLQAGGNAVLRAHDEAARTPILPLGRKQFNLELNGCLDAFDGGIRAV